MIFVVSGPTGSGKTDLALELACEWKLPVFNADPFQFYREIPVLSNQPDAALSHGLHFLAFQSLRQPISSGDFARLSLDHLQEPGIWVGTGLYMGAVLFGLDEDRRKGTPFVAREPRARYRMCVIDRNREELYRALDDRVEKMLTLGALDEARAIVALKKNDEISENNPVLKAIGLRHLLWHLEDGLDWQETIRLWKRDTRRLAKRQWTWLRKFCPPSSIHLWKQNPESSRQEITTFFLRS